jgi:chromosome segregation ATPase
VSDEPQEIEQLRRRYEQLATKKTQAETRLDESTQQLETLKSEARTKYGTDDLAELQAKLQEMEAENLRRRREYQRLLDKIESDLKGVEDRTSAGSE